MFKDLVRNLVLSLLPDEKYHTGDVIGEWQDVITHKDGRVEELPWRKNLIAKTFSTLAACLCKGEAGFAGLTYIEVGTGEVGWDSVTPAPDANATGLVNPLARKAVNVTFLDPSNNPTAARTNRIQIEATFAVGEAIGTWRTFGAFGGNATATLGTGYLADIVNHGRMDKTAGENDFSVTRRIRFTF